LKLQPIVVTLRDDDVRPSSTAPESPQHLRSRAALQIFSPGTAVLSPHKQISSFFVERSVHQQIDC
jgi:hypothetical protein